MFFLGQKKLLVCRYEEDVVEFDDDFTGFGKYHYIVYDSDTKGSFGSREVFLTEDAIYILDLLRSYYESNKIESEWLFYSKREKDKIHDRALDIRIEQYCKQIGIPKKSIHKIRATYVSLLRDAGLTFEAIATQVGHKSTRTTENNYSFDLKAEKENQDKITFDLSSSLNKKVFKSVQTID